MSDQREPDQTEDPRKQEVGQGLGETAPEEVTPDDEEERLPDE
jgi:hypothetical protein